MRGDAAHSRNAVIYANETMERLLGANSSGKTLSSMHD